MIRDSIASRLLSHGSLWNAASCSFVPARRYLVQGRVQGVGFRWFVERQARALKLTGWVRNLDSGEVEVLAQGDPASLERLRGELQRGPIGSRVTGVEESEAPEGRLRGFTITD